MSRKRDRTESGGKRGSLVGGLAKAFFSLILLVAAIAGAAACWGYSQYVQAGPSSENGAPRVVNVPKGATLDDISTLLERSGAVRSAGRFRLAVRAVDLLRRNHLLQGDPVTLKAGEYAVPSAASMADILAQLSGGASLQYAVIIPEGLTSAAIVDLLSSREWTSPNGGGRKIRLTGNVSESPAEGTLLPGDYMVQNGDDIASVIERMQRAQADLVKALWAARQPGLPLASPEEAVNLASIVEKETGLPDERPQVAAVFINRLRKGMRLETDPTIIYGVCLKRPASCRNGKLVDAEGGRRVIRASEIALDTGYNTYRIDGLPPTPICNPGKDAIAAVLSPPASDALFFVANGKGGHVFAATYAEHQKNVATWRTIEADALAEERKSAP